MKLSILFSSKLTVVCTIVCYGWWNYIRVAHARNQKTFALAVGLWCVAPGGLWADYLLLDFKRDQRPMPWQNSPAHLFIRFYLCITPCGRAFGRLPRIKHIVKACGFSASGNGHRMCLLSVPGGGWVASGRKRSLLSMRVIEPDGESGKCWIRPLQTPKPKAWEMRTSSALLELVDGSW